jgi:hypothetical protein
MVPSELVGFDGCDDGSVIGLLAPLLFACGVLPPTLLVHLASITGSHEFDEPSPILEIGVAESLVVTGGVVLTPLSPPLGLLPGLSNWLTLLLLPLQPYMSVVGSH